MAPKEWRSPATLPAQLGMGLPLAALQRTSPAPNTPRVHGKHPQRQGSSAPLHQGPRSGREQHPLPGGEKTEPLVQQWRQGTGSGTGPGRCYSHPGSAESPWVPLPRLSPQRGAGGSRLRHHRLQPPASAAPAIYTGWEGARPSPGNPETQQQPRRWMHPSGAAGSPGQLAQGQDDLAAPDAALCPQRSVAPSPGCLWGQASRRHAPAPCPAPRRVW